MPDTDRCMLLMRAGETGSGGALEIPSAERSCVWSYEEGGLNLGADPRAPKYWIEASGLKLELQEHNFGSVRSAFKRPVQEGCS